MFLRKQTSQASVHGDMANKQKRYEVLVRGKSRHVAWPGRCRRATYVYILWRAAAERATAGPQS